MVISMNAEKSFEKIQYPVIIKQTKTYNKQNILDKGHLQKKKNKTKKKQTKQTKNLQLSLILHGGNLNNFP